MRTFRFQALEGVTNLTDYR